MFNLDNLIKFPLWLSGITGRIVIFTVLALLLVYYPLGMFIVHKVDADVAFEAKAPAGGSEAVAVAAALVQRELDRHWVPNDPFFLPGAALTRMPAFQKGLVTAVARFTLALSDNVARTRGSSAADADLQKAVGLFNYPPTVWIYDTSVSWLPTASSESQYRSAVEALNRYNQRLSEGHAVFERRSDNLLDTLDRFAADLGSSSGLIAEAVQHQSSVAFFANGALMYETKGKMYAYYLLMRDLGKDFAPVIQEKQLQTIWDQTLESLKDGAELSTPLVINAAPDRLFFPSHLAGQGFFLMRARTQLREVTNILLK